MKKILELLLILLFAPCIVSAEGSKVDNAKELEETMQWIKSKASDAFAISDRVTVYNKDGTATKISWTKKNFRITYKDCELTFENIMDFSIKNTRHTDLDFDMDSESIDTINFKLGDIGSIETTQDKDDKDIVHDKLPYRIIFKTSNDMKKINRTLVDIKTNTGKLNDKSETLSDVSFILHDQSMAERMVKAFTYAVQLCGGKTAVKDEPKVKEKF